MILGFALGELLPYVVFCRISAFISFFLYLILVCCLFSLACVSSIKAKEKVKKAKLTTWFFTFDLVLITRFKQVKDNIQKS